MSGPRPVVAGPRGFTLIETIITVLIVGIASAAIFVPFMTSLGGAPRAVVTQQALSLIQGESEQLIAERRANGFGAIATGVGMACAIPTPAGFTCTRDICFVPAANLNACGAASSFLRATITVNHAVTGDITTVTALSDY